MSTPPRSRSRTAIALSFVADGVDGRQALFSKDASGEGGGGHIGISVANGMIAVRMQSSGHTFDMYGGPVEAGREPHVAVTFGDGGWTLYVDGVAVNTNAFTGGLGANREPIVLGANQWGSTPGTADDLDHPFEGAITGAAIYDAPLSAELVAQLAGSDAPPPPVEEPKPAVTPPTEDPPTVEPPPVVAPPVVAPPVTAGAVFVDAGGRFDGASTAKVVAHDAALALADGTIALAFTADGVGGRQSLLSKDARDFGAGGHLTVGVTNGKIEARLQSDTASYTLSGGAVEAGRDHHVALTFGAGGLKLWVDGVVVDEDAYTGGLLGNAEPIVLGASQWRSAAETANRLEHGFEGTIEDVAIFAEALDAAGVVALSAGGAPPPAPQNAAPVALAAPALALALTEGEDLDLALDGLFSDADGDTLSNEVLEAPAFATRDGGVLRIAPGDADAGVYTLLIRASDGQAESGDLSVTLTVADAIGVDPDPTPARVTLDATAGILEKGTIGPQEWGDGVTLTGYAVDGSLAEVRFSTQFDDHGFGVAGPSSRWVGQIDFVKTPDGGRSEELHIDFGGLVEDVMLGIGMLGLNEGRNGNDETGRWTAFDAVGAAIGTGPIGPDTSALGADVKTPGSYGEYPIAIDLGVPIARLVPEATQFGHGAGDFRGSNANSSDFNVTSLSYGRVDEPNSGSLYG